MTDRTPPALAFEPLGSREVVASFDGGLITADAGALLRRELDSRSGFIDSFTRCFTDHRDPERIEHPPADLLRPRIFGLGLGYEDLNEHDPVRFDPLFAVAVGKTDPLGLRGGAARWWVDQSLQLMVLADSPHGGWPWTRRRCGMTAT